jgi:carboxymethylenebutenolidase
VEPESIVLERGDTSIPTLVYRDRGASPGPAVVIAAEAYGVNRFTRDVASRLAAAGSVVVVPDYYRGAGLTRPDDYSDFTEVVSFIERLDFVGATHDVMTAVGHARALPEVDPARVVVWGYCTGGTLAMLASSLDRSLAGAVWFFPSQPTFEHLGPTRPVHAVDLLWNVACPVLVVYGEEDPVAPAEVIADLRRRLEQWGVDHEVRLYPGAGHAFCSPGPPLHHAEADAASWVEAMAFLTRVVS